MNRNDALKAAAMKGAIQTIENLITALEQQRRSIQQQLDHLLDG